MYRFKQASDPTSRLTERASFQSKCDYRSVYARRTALINNIKKRHNRSCHDGNSECQIVAVAWQSEINKRNAKSSFVVKSSNAIPLRRRKNRYRGQTSLVVSSACHSKSNCPVSCTKREKSLIITSANDHKNNRRYFNSDRKHFSRIRRNNVINKRVEHTDVDYINVESRSADGDTYEEGERTVTDVQGFEYTKETLSRHAHKNVVENNNDKGGGRLYRLMRGLYRFSRPHTMAGTFVSITSISLIAMRHFDSILLNAINHSEAMKATLTILSNSQMSSYYFLSWLQAVLAALFANVAIVGFNQINDVAIDKINKPYLPLANGDMSVPGAWIIIGVSSILAVAISCINVVSEFLIPSITQISTAMSDSSTAAVLSSLQPNAWLLIAVISSLALGVLYSSKRVRLKKNPFMAAACIFAVRAIIVQICFYYHTIGALSHNIFKTISFSSLGMAGSSYLETFVKGICKAPGTLLICIGFMSIFSVVIALAKDLPDVKGDQESGIKTACIRVGIPKVFSIVLVLLTCMYVGSGILACSGLTTTRYRAFVVAAAHLFATVSLWREYNLVMFSAKETITRFYMFLWKLFYFEYLLFPFMY